MMSDSLYTTPFPKVLKVTYKNVEEVVEMVRMLNVYCIILMVIGRGMISLLFVIMIILRIERMKIYMPYIASLTTVKNHFIAGGRCS